MHNIKKQITNIIKYIIFLHITHTHLGNVYYIITTTF